MRGGIAATVLQVFRGEAQRGMHMLVRDAIIALHLITGKPLRKHVQNEVDGDARLDNWLPSVDIRINENTGDSKRMLYVVVSYSDAPPHILLPLCRYVVTSRYVMQT
jgi:hypothetical protein